MNAQPEEAASALPEDASASPSSDLQYSVDALFPPHWRGKLLNTKPLEALLRNRPSSSSASEDTSGPFFEELRQQMQSVSKTFNKAARKASRAAKCLPSDGKQVSIWFWSKWRAFKVAGSDTVIPLTSNSVTEEAAWCYTYAQVNKAILERVLQQHDLLLGNNEGKKFFKDAHCVGEPNVLSTPSFLHSPLLEELLALQSRVSQQTINREAKERAREMKRNIRQQQKTSNNSADLDLVQEGNGDLDPKCMTAASTNVPPASTFAPPPPVDGASTRVASTDDVDVHVHEVSTTRREASPVDGADVQATGIKSSQPQPAATLANSIPPRSVREEMDASMHRKGSGPLLPMDVGDGVPARKKLLRKQSEPYIPRRACLQEIRQRLHVTEDVANPLCKEDDLTCSICLDYFCQPVGLACGHVFCMSCLVDAMKGSVLLRPQVLPRTGRCPECRQQNVCRTCVELRELDKLVQLRHPKEHRAKLQDWEWRVHIALQGRFVYGRASMISAFPMAMPL